MKTTYDVVANVEPLATFWALKMELDILVKPALRYLYSLKRAKAVSLSGYIVRTLEK